MNLAAERPAQGADPRAQTPRWESDESGTGEPERPRFRQIGDGDGDRSESPISANRGPGSPASSSVPDNLKSGDGDRVSAPWPHECPDRASG
jgi:hypothetical protein